MEEILKEALLEASFWEHQLTDDEKSKITFEEARNQVIDRILVKYKSKILKK